MVELGCCYRVVVGDLVDYDWVSCVVVVSNCIVDLFVVGFFI